MKLVWSSRKHFLSSILLSELEVLCPLQQELCFCLWLQPQGGFLARCVMLRPSRWKMELPNKMLHLAPITQTIRKLRYLGNTSKGGSPQNSKNTSSAPPKTGIIQQINGKQLGDGICEPWLDRKFEYIDNWDVKKEIWKGWLVFSNP